MRSPRVQRPEVLWLSSRVSSDASRQIAKLLRCSDASLRLHRHVAAAGSISVEAARSRHLLERLSVRDSDAAPEKSPAQHDLRPLASANRKRSRYT